MTDREIRALRADRHRARREEWSERDARIRSLWPTKAIREIAIDVGMTAQAVVHRGYAMDLPSRPIARQP